LLAWLSDWLKQLLAVVLLASVVELLLPGNSFHRYMRLVLGLLILLAMLSPVMALVRGDPSRLLDRSIRSWEASSRNAAPGMPTLEDIERDARKLQEARQREAALLAARNLEFSMEEELRREAGIDGARVKVELAWDASEGASFRSVSVTLAAASAGGGAGGGTAKSGGGWGGGYGGSAGRKSEGDSGGAAAGSVEAIEAIEPIDVMIDWPDEQARGIGAGGYGRDRVSVEADPAIAAKIRAIVQQRWGVEPARIAVSMAAE